MSDVILITGAGSGFGNLSARTLAQAGYTVYASMRDIADSDAPRARALREHAAEQGVDLRVVELDVSFQQSANAAVRTIVAAAGRLDVIVHNVGHLVLGPTEAFSAEEMLATFDTNVLGAQRVNRAALPHLRAQGSGLLLWVSSTTAWGGFPPFMGPYAAAKAAMDSLATTVSYEVARFGVETSIIVPGAFISGTDHVLTAGRPADAERVAAYEDRYAGMPKRIGRRLAELTQPEADAQTVADEIARIIGLPAGARPFRSVVDFVGDGARAVLDVAEKARIDFAERMGIGDLLRPASN
jgi:NAD(P)-dependent dehydrogenase (short-subunit alcohol dehydrogenase family)